MGRFRRVRPKARNWLSLQRPNFRTKLVRRVKVRTTVCSYLVTRSTVAGREHIRGSQSFAGVEFSRYGGSCRGETTANLGMGIGLDLHIGRLLLGVLGQQRELP